MINLLYTLLLLCAFPAGYLLAYLCKDELVSGRKWFLLLSAVSLIIAVLLSFTKFLFKFPIILSLFFVIIICLMAAWKSYDKSFL